MASNAGRCPPAGLAEQDVVGAALGRDHGVMAGVQSAAAGDPFGLEPLDRTR